MATVTHSKGLGNVFLIQGIYFVVTGIWPLLNMASFITATGPKQDTWMAEMVGLSSASIGLTFIVSSLRQRPSPVLLGYAVAASFLAMDITYLAAGESSEARRVGKEGVSTCRSRWSPY